MLAGNVNVGVPLVLHHLNVIVYVLLALLHHFVIFVILPLFALLTVISLVAKSIVTHALLSVHVNIIVAVASFFIYGVLHHDHVHTGAVLSKYISALFTVLVAKLFHALSLTAQLLHT